MPRSRSSPTGIPSSSGVPLLQPPTRDTPSYNRSAYNNVPTAQQQHPEVAIVPHQGGGGGQVQVAPGAMVLRGGVAGGHGSSVTNGGFDQVRASFRLKLEWCGSRARAFYRKAGFSRVVSRLMPTCVSHPELIRVSLPNCLCCGRASCCRHQFQAQGQFVRPTQNAVQGQQGYGMQQQVRFADVCVALWLLAPARWALTQPNGKVLPTRQIWMTLLRFRAGVVSALQDLHSKSSMSAPFPAESVPA